MLSTEEYKKARKRQLKLLKEIEVLGNEMRETDKINRLITAVSKLLCNYKITVESEGGWYAGNCDEYNEVVHAIAAYEER